MGKGQSHKQSRIGKYIEGLMGMEMIVSDPAQKQKLQEQIKEAHREWFQAGWERKFPDHDFDGNLIDNKQNKTQNGSG